MATTSEPGFVAAVAECAYFKAERRGFMPGFELEDWLAAERELTAPVEARPAVRPPRRKPRLKSVPTSPARAAKSKAAKAASKTSDE